MDYYMILLAISIILTVLASVVFRKRSEEHPKKAIVVSLVLTPVSIVLLAVATAISFPDLVAYILVACIFVKLSSARFYWQEFQKVNRG